MVKFKLGYSLVFRIVLLSLGLSLFFQNCGNVILVGRENSSAAAPELPAPAPLPLAPQNTLETPPTVTAGQCDDFWASQPSYAAGEEPAIYFLCSKLLIDPVANAATREVNFTFSPELTVDLSQIAVFIRGLQDRLNRSDSNVSGLKINWWASDGAPAFETNPAEPNSRLLVTPSAAGSFTVYFQLVQGTDAGLVHKINFEIKDIQVAENNNTFNCPGFAKTISINPYTPLVYDIYFTSSHGFIDSNTAIVLKFTVPTTPNNTGNGFIQIMDPFTEGWQYETHLSTRNCDFETNKNSRYVFNELQYYTTSTLQNSSGEPIPSLYKVRLVPGKTYYLNMKPNACGINNDIGTGTTGRFQHNCGTQVIISNPQPAGWAAKRTLVNEFTGGYMIDETGKPALWPRYWTPLPTYKNLDNGLFYYPGGSSNSGYPGPSGGSGNFNNGL